MNILVRKTWNFGPLRLNLSKTGLGGSIGCAGLRLGIAAHGGIYVHFSRGGLSYRKYLFSGRREEAAD